MPSEEITSIARLKIKKFQNLLKCKQTTLEKFSLVQFSSNSAQDVRRRRNPETSRNIVFLENIQLLLEVTTPKEYKKYIFQQTCNNFVSFELLFTKLSGIHPYEKCIK